MQKGKTVAIVGTGLIGRAWAAASRSCPVPWVSLPAEPEEPGKPRLWRSSPAPAGTCGSPIRTAPTLEAAREIDGFALNRLQGALLAEAFRLVGEATSPRKIWITR
jgi:3-hydroxyacyl-CoA dehydrogenase